MRKTEKNKQWFSIIVAVFMIGFLLVLTTGVFNLVLREMKDNRWAENYLKAYAGAEWAMELGLLNIKENWYATDKDLWKGEDAAKSLTFSWVYKQQSDPLITYKTEIEIQSLTGVTMTGWETVLIPLFSNNLWVKKPSFTANTDIIWNIIWRGEWMSWSWNFDYSTTQVYKKNDWTYSSLESIESFLNTNTGSYLMLFNKWTPTTYDLRVWASELFSKPVWNITSSVTVGKYKQNISTSIDNTEFLNMLKYSVFSK